ncbi:hypothetical protein [Haloplanus pelagicus]|uniref:hypothetical protein n=1 Tax=Haloplanus pelagicus TaxID=2949995 RepID=UPI00203B45D4|nr:hypothetical protein [Haloplanus sp. HW8-1]
MTSRLLAVLEHVNSRLGEDILETLVDESDLFLVAFDNQVTGVASVSDAAIRGSTALWFKPETGRNAVRQNRLGGHPEALDQDPSDLQRSIVLTPDETANDSNRTVAFVQGDRYVSLSTLRESPHHTIELEE